jgi:glycosyltransferase involved in cell wall biosynthesis
MEGLRVQTLRDIEIIAVDNGSVDATRLIFDVQARLDPRVRVLPADPEGIVPALSVGIAAARSPMIERAPRMTLAHDADAKHVRFCHCLGVPPRST